MAISSEVLRVVSSALSGGCEVTLESIVSALGTQGMILEQLGAVKNFLSEWSFELFPPLSKGDFTTPRILKATTAAHFSEEFVALEVSQGETSSREFKSSLLYNHKRAQAMPGTPLQQLRSDAVIYSALKTIAAFMNTHGGVLFVGISDDLVPVGLLEDCLLLGSQVFDADKWQLEFRNHITGKFKDGTMVNDYVEVKFVELNHKHVARIHTLARNRLTFLRQDGVSHLYRRQGNRTTELTIDEIEEFLEMRRGLEYSIK